MTRVARELALSATRVFLGVLLAVITGIGLTAVIVSAYVLVNGQ